MSSENEQTPRLELPYLFSGQAQKELFHNMALNRLDALLACVLASRTETAPPAAPEPMQAWLLPAGVQGDWAGQAGRIALWLDGWDFLDPPAGLKAWIADEDRHLFFDGQDWRAPHASPGQGQLAESAVQPTGLAAALADYAPLAGAAFTGDVGTSGNLSAANNIHAGGGFLTLGGGAAGLSADGTYCYLKDADGATRLFFGRAGADNRVIVELQDQAGGASFQVRDSGAQSVASVSSLGDADFQGAVSAAGYASAGQAGVSGSFQSADGKTVTVTGGLVTDIS
ncbi:DUF2793 domain-containing protein [Fodinicurvata fenggangensis]|uniref:DUF2793 domain-containing protein n=1 Tax=Fodinicurvata fenggangensis TaxID=1121830 RepID=UPI00068D2951|nr:DUF2793 domain-containing protein [Fodinicurvata fenggangensis]